MIKHKPLTRGDNGQPAHQGVTIHSIIVHYFGTAEYSEYFNNLELIISIKALQFLKFFYRIEKGIAYSWSTFSKSFIPRYSK